MLKLKDWEFCFILKNILQHYLNAHIECFIIIYYYRLLVAAVIQVCHFSAVLQHQHIQASLWLRGTGLILCHTCAGGSLLGHCVPPLLESRIPLSRASHCLALPDTWSSNGSQRVCFLPGSTCYMCSPSLPPHCAPLCFIRPMFCYS